MRTRKLVAPTLQLKLTLWFACTVLVGLVFQSLLVSSQLSALAHRLPGDPARHLESMNTVSWNTFWASVLVVLPLTVAVGILTTFRLVGPLHRLGDFLARIVAGEKPADCQLRKGDELQDFCSLLNEATEPLRTRETPQQKDRAEPTLRRVA